MNKATRTRNLKVNDCALLIKKLANIEDILIMYVKFDPLSVRRKSIAVQKIYFQIATLIKQTRLKQTYKMSFFKG